MKNNQEILIIKADKGKKLVVMDTEEYNNKMQNLIGGEDYTIISKSPSDKIDKELRSIVGKISPKIKKEEKLFEKIITHYNREPTIFANPKVHKEGVPLRPIVSGFGTVLSNAAKFITPILEGLYLELDGENVEIKNSYQAKEKLNKNTNRSFILFSLDIKDMFGSIKPEEAYNIVDNLVQKSTNFKTLTTISKSVFLKIFHSDQQFVF